MKNKDDKKKDLEALKKDLAENSNIFVTGYEKMTVAQDNILRRTVRDAGGQYKVVKNNLAAKASEGTAAEKLLAELKGMTSLAFAPKEEIFAKLLFLINATATRLVTAVNGTGRNLAVVIDQAAKEGKFPE